MGLESKLQTRIKNNLKKRGWRVIKAILLSESGHPDLWCCKKGRLVLLEIKSETGIHEPLQKYRQKQWRDDGFTCECVYTYDEYLKLEF